MSNTRQATPAAKGYILQGYFGIYFFFKDKNYKEIDWLKIESPKEDIEIHYYDGSKDFIQVKTHEKPTKKTNFDTQAFKKGILTLYEALENTPERKVNRLILANNMLNQGIERLNNKLKIGEEENYIYNINDAFTLEEIENFSIKIKNEIKNILHLARVDESYLLNNSKILPELKKVINELELQNVEGNINDSLKILFDENSCDRKLIIDKKQVAWSFIKHKITQSKIYDRFNRDFSKEIENVGIIEIQFLVEDYEIADMIKNYSGNYEIYMFFQRKLEEHHIKYEKITTTNLKDAMSEIAIEMLERQYLCLYDKYLEEAKLIYCFFAYFLFFNNNNVKKIYDEFNIKKVKNEIIQADN